ncbi:MAG: DUF3100 domain-containing protein [Comamonas sp.]
MSHHTPTLEAATADPARPARFISMSLRHPGLWVLLAFTVVNAAIAQFIGPFTVPLGGASIMLLPMIWALLLGLLASAQKIRPLPLDLQHVASSIMGLAVLMLCARLSLTLGPQLPTLYAAGPALLLQELGNVFGSILLALPLAVLLRMGPATIGATFSIDREASFAIVTSRFGADSPQYRGVLSMYVFGSIFGAIIVSLVASVLSSLGIFDWRALAMGAGVGSGSMMAAGIASITAAHPEHAEGIAALTTTANLIASLGSVYLAMYLSLPVAERLYKVLARNQTERGAATLEKIQNIAAHLDTPKVKMSPWVSLLVISVTGLVTAVIASKGFHIDMLITYAVLSGMIAFSLWLATLTRGKLPAVITIITLGCVATMPGSPIAPWLLATSASLNFLAVITMMLAIAGLSIGKDLPMLKEIGWKILPVGVVVIGATLIVSTVIAQFVLGLIG